ncbi:hypothetical protein J6Q66_03840 [bacterium]|nr:hypothetical protein [bacterium]
MKIIFNTNYEYSRKNNVNYRNTNIHNHFNVQKNDTFTSKSKPLNFGAKYRILKDKEINSYWRDIGTELTQKDAVKYFFMGLWASLVNLKDNLKFCLYLFNQEDENKFLKKDSVYSRLTSIGKTVLNKRGLLNEETLGKNGVLRLTLLSNENFERLQKRNLLNIPERKNHQLNAETICALVKVDDEKYKKIKRFFYIEKLGKRQLDSSDIHALTSYNNEQLDNAYEIINWLFKNINISNFDLILRLSTLDKQKLKYVKELAHIPERKEKQFTLTEIYNFCESASSNQLKKIKKLAKLQRKTFNGEPAFLRGGEIKLLSGLSDKKLEMAKKFLYIPERKAEQLDVDDIVQIVQLPKAQYEKVNSILYVPERKADQFYGSHAITLSQLDWGNNNEKMKKVLYIKERGYDQFATADIYGFLSKLKDNEFIKAEKLFYIPERKKHQFTGHEILRLAQLPEEKFKIAEKYFHLKQLSADLIENIAEIKTKNISKMTFSEKTNFLNDFKWIRKNIKNKELLKEIGVDDLQDQAEKELNCATKTIEVSSQNKTDFFKNFIVLNNTKTKEILTNLSPILEKYGKTGLPLKYPREEYVKKLTQILSTVPTDAKQNILKKMDIELIEDLNGFNGLLQIHKLNSNDKTEKEILEETQKFLLQNEVITENEDINKKLNILIKAIPEFLNVIGKKQHQTHQYTVDCHTLKVLEETLKHPKFETLTPQNKILLQLAVIFHDFGKDEGVIDSGHELKSAHLTNSILKKINLPEEKKDIITEFVKNHDWFAKLQKGTSPEEIAIIFKNPQGLDMAEIFANSDLLGVSKEFHDLIISKNQINVELIKNLQKDIYNYGNLIFTTHILNPQKIPVVNHKGHEYRVLDFTKFSDDEDLFNYGLNIHKKADFNVLFHAGNGNILKLFSDPTNEGVICTSLISPTRKRTYGYCNLGFMLESSNLNIVNTFNVNQGSGDKKTFNYFFSEIFCNKHEFRDYAQYIFLDTLKSKYKIKLKDEEYGELFKRIHNKKFLTQITDEKIGKKNIKKEIIIDGIKSINEHLLKNADVAHNEINVYNPKIKALIFIGDSISEIRNKYLRFARENNLPIFILGS